MIRERAAAAAAKCRTFAAAAAAKLKERARWAWRHRTKTAGGLIASAGGFKEWAVGHPAIHLPGEGWLLIGAGALVGAIGAYNTIATIFGWEDDP